MMAVEKVGNNEGRSNATTAAAPAPSRYSCTIESVDDELNHVEDTAACIPTPVKSGVTEDGRVVDIKRVEATCVESSDDVLVYPDWIDGLLLGWSSAVVGGAIKSCGDGPASCALGVGGHNPRLRRGTHSWGTKGHFSQRISPVVIALAAASIPATIIYKYVPWINGSGRYGVGDHDSFSFMQCPADTLYGTNSTTPACCNGLQTNCILRADEIVWATVHNAMSSVEDGFVAPNNRKRLEVRAKHASMSDHEEGNWRTCLFSSSPPLILTKFLFSLLKFVLCQESP